MLNVAIRTRAPPTPCQVAGLTFIGDTLFGTSGTLGRNPTGVEWFPVRMGPRRGAFTSTRGWPPSLHAEPDGESGV
jgi:hypothetical protein